MTSFPSSPGGPEYDTEEEEWLHMTPEQRLEESGKLWAIYLALGGSLDPEPDPQSPFYFPEAPGAGAADRGPGSYPVRRRGVQS